MYGVLAARCECGGWLPTTLAGRALLPRRCRICQRDLEHPQQGRLPEYVIVLWGAEGTGKTAWLHLLLGEIAAGSEADAIANAGQRRRRRRPEERLRQGERPEPTRTESPLAWSVAPVSPGFDRRLLHLFDLPGPACVEPHHAADFPFFVAMNGLILLVDVGPTVTPERLRLQTRAIETLQDCWDRQRSGRVPQRHDLPVAILVQGLPAGTKNVAEALADHLVADALLAAVEAHFHMHYFLWSPREPALPVLHWLMGEM